MFDLRELERAHAIVGAAVPPTPALCLAAAGQARRRRSLGQAREPHADRRLQGARRTGLCRPRRAERPRRAGFSRRRAAITASRWLSPGSVSACPSPLFVPHGKTVPELTPPCAPSGRGSSNMARISTPPEIRGRCGWRTRTRGLTFAPSFHRDLVLGVSTWALELFEAAPGLDILYVPIGLGSGTCGTIVRATVGISTESWACTRPKRRLMPFPSRQAWS